MNLKNQTPAPMRCAKCDKCPSIHEDTNTGDFVVVGKQTDDANRAQLAATIAADEDTVTLPRELLLRWVANLDADALAEVERYRNEANNNGLYLHLAQPHN